MRVFVFVLGSPPGCHDCGPCYANWTNTIKDLLTKIQDQDARVKTLIATRYRNQTTEELASNVTTLRSLLTTIMTNFDDNTTLLSDDVNQLSDRLTEVCKIAVHCLFFMSFLRTD